jgi:hypothetical protein
MTQDRTATLQELERLLSLSAEETLAPYGVRGGACRADHVPTDGSTVVATIEFSAPRASGSITIVAGYHVVEDLRPEGVTASDEALICDVLGELANLMLGRLKAHLRRRGVGIVIGIPTKGLLATTSLRAAGDSGECSWHRCDLGRGPVCVRFQATIDDELLLTEETDDPPVELIAVAGANTDDDEFFFVGGLE